MDDELCPHGIDTLGKICKQCGEDEVERATLLGMVPGAHVLIHRWSGQVPGWEQEGHIHPAGLEINDNDVVFALIEDDANLFGTYQVIEVNGYAIPGGGEW